MFSRSHHAGRDADLSFYRVDAAGQPIATTDLFRVDGSLRGLDLPRTWGLVDALMGDSSIDIQWLFVSPAIKRALITEGRRQGASLQTLSRAAQLLHQPSDAPLHDDHLHLRIRCTRQELQEGCKDR